MQAGDAATKKVVCGLSPVGTKFPALSMAHVPQSPREMRVMVTWRPSGPPNAQRWPTRGRTSSPEPTPCAAPSGLRMLFAAWLISGVRQRKDEALPRANRVRGFRSSGLCRCCYYRFSSRRRIQLRATHYRISSFVGLGVGAGIHYRHGREFHANKRAEQEEASGVGCHRLGECDANCLFRCGSIHVVQRDAPMKKEPNQ